MKRWFSNVYVLIIILISLLGIATSGLLFLLIPGPDEIIRQAQARVTQLQSFQVDVDLRYRGERPALVGSETEAFALQLSSQREAGNPAESDSLDKFSLTTGAEAASSLRFAGERRTLGRSQFYRFDELPAQLGALHLDRFRGIWLRIDVPRLLALTSLPLYGGGRQPLGAEARAELIRDFRVTPFVAALDTLAGEQIGGVATHHYKVRPEILYFRDYFALAEARRLGRELTDQERLAIEAYFADIAPEDGELWIGKRDRLPHRARFRFRFDDGTRHGTFDLTIEFSRFNEPVAVAAPTGEVQDATPFLESILAGLRSHLPLAKAGAVQRGTTAADTGLPIEARSQADDDPDRDGLPNVLEGFYLTDAANPDTDGDGMTDGDEVSQGRNPTGAGLLFDFGITR